MRIEATPCCALPPEEWARLEAIAENVFGHYALVRETEWAQPDWCFRCHEGDALAAFHNLVLRSVEMDGAVVRVAGLNNMITMPAFRGRGVASWLLRATQPRWFEELDADCGMLLCAEELVPFYARLAWRRLEARVFYDQPSGKKTWAASCMVLDPKGLVGAPREVDLRGMPW